MVATALQAGGNVTLIVVFGAILLFPTFLPLIPTAIVGLWMMFEKAGEPGWKALVPIYNLWVLVDISGKEWWWFLVLFVPSANLAAWVIVNLGLGDRFGQRDAFGVIASVFFFVVYPLLGFGDYEYQSDREGRPT